MSNHHLSLVREIKNIKGPSRAVLLVLADRSDEAGTCYPGMARIAKESGFSRTTVKSALKSLKADGWISWKQRRDDYGDLTSNLYTIDLGRAGADPPRAGDDLGVGREPTYPRAGADHKASLKHQGEASLFENEILPITKPDSTKKSHREIAEAIYSEYPKKVAKAAAIKAIIKAMKSHDPSMMLERTKAYASEIQWKERQFIPYPATWFNNEGFDDDPSEWNQPTTSKPKPTTKNATKLL